MNTPRAKLLLVDDDTATIRILHEMLRPHYDVHFANDGVIALELAERERPDLILLDVRMQNVDGYTICRELKRRATTRTVPVIFLTGLGDETAQTEGFDAGAVDFIVKPVNPRILLARVSAQLQLASQARALEELVRERTSELEQTQIALREAMHNLRTTEIAPGVYWVEVPEVALYILCGCPAEVVKHLIRKGFIRTVTRDGKSYETGPNAILLSDVLVQNGGIANLAEFPVLQMLYRQGMILPGHPNNTGVKPLLIGSREQLDAQIQYIHRGNYGLVDRAEIEAAGIDPDAADLMMRVKLKFAFGAIRPPTEFLDTVEVKDSPCEIRDGVRIWRVGLNRFRISYREGVTEVDLNLAQHIRYEIPYPLGQHRHQPQYFAVLHTGEGDGWDINRPCASALIMFQGRKYLIDAGPGILDTLTALGIDVTEIHGIFHTHAHDDHFAGLTALIHSDRRLEYLATRLVRTSVAKKFAALMSLPESKFEEFFVVRDLDFDCWNDCDGLEVKPLYSPHPVENSVLLFRAQDATGHKTYAHWTDLSSFAVLDGMVGDGPADLPASFVDTVKRNYLTHADLKKLDIGGGLIHGVAEDFRDDDSSRLILAHIARPLTASEMVIGSETTFGALDILIPGDGSHAREPARAVLQALFPEARPHEIRLLLNAPTVDVNAGTIIRAPGDASPYVDMVLAGAVRFLDPHVGINHRLAFGTLIGFDELMGRMEGTGTFRALSHCTLLRMPAVILRDFLVAHGLHGPLAALLDKVAFLRRTRLFGEQVGFQRRVALARAIKELPLAEGPARIGLDGTLWLVRQGTVSVADEHGQLLEEIGAGDFVGEASVLGYATPRLQFLAREATVLYGLSAGSVLEIPIAHWKLIETLERRAKAGRAMSGPSA